MSGNIKKASLCDYCKTEKDANQLYTARKQFGGFRIIDILEIVTKVKIPANTPIKLCTMCASTLHVTTGVIERAGAMISKFVPMSKSQAAGINQKPINTNSDTEPDDAKEVPLSTDICNSPSKNTVIPNGTSTVVKKHLDKTAKQQQQQLTTGSPSKLDESLKHVIKLTPADDTTPNKSKAFIQLFGNSVNHISDSDDCSEDDEEITTEITNKKNIAINFECKMCDFTSTYPNPMKRHLKDLHGQKRPRIYNCLKCTKTFGILKTLKIHLLTHGIVEESGKNQDNNEQAKDPQLAVLTALKPRPKAKSSSNAELTFAIQDTNSSTPKPADGPNQPQLYQCEVCQEPYKSVKTIQKHMQMAHNIEKPRIFKCDQCDANFMHKTTLDRHVKVKHGDGLDPPKAPRRRKTVDERALLANNTNGTDGAEKQQTLGKIAARRKTVDVSIALAELPTKSRKLSNVFDDMDGVYPKKPKLSTELLKDPIKPTASPKKKSKTNNEDTVAVPLAPLNVSANEKSAPVTPINKSKPKTKTVEIISAVQIAPLNTDTPNKKLKKVGDVVNSPLSTNSTPKNNKPKKDKDGFATPQNTPIITATGTGGSSSSVKRKKDELDTTHLQSNGNESSSSSNKKSRKHNAKKLSESLQSSQLVIDEGAQDDAEIEEGEIQPSPLKKPKYDSDEVIELLDEINDNPVPHHREILASMSQESVNSDFYSCNQCSKVVSSRKRLDSHMKKKHLPLLKCIKCHNVFNESIEYVAHFATCAKSSVLACGIEKCDKVFGTANFLSSHLRKKHHYN